MEYSSATNCGRIERILFKQLLLPSSRWRDAGTGRTENDENEEPLLTSSSPLSMAMVMAMAMAVNNMYVKC